ncbi:MAG: LD-carboxypeptidase [Candidatus Marinimicrobia bacterium]|nr:LD-carboxypeptidase [Candidatus Neomarinimicrobiota bacterium]MBL7031035.1 LD-carboxypeptidase [Candidatus Neomarinimicrobiota bacterium]
MIKPKQLQKGDRIGVVSPSYWLEGKGLEHAVDVFQTEGYEVQLGKSVLLKDGPFAGSPQQRANDINQMFSDPNIDAIICARGGYGANRVLPLLDYEAIKENPKIFMGYSDITAFLTSITQKTELVTFHGPMLSTFKNGLVPYNMDTLVNILSGNKGMVITEPSSLKITTLKHGVAEGSLWGGNMCLLVNRLGTKDQLKTDGVILFIEDIDENLYAFDRLLIHMREAGMFENIRGLIIGELVEMKDQAIPFGKSTDEIVLDVCGDLDIPIISNFPCGHGAYQATLPISLPVQLNAGQNPVKLTFLESPVSKGY